MMNTIAQRKPTLGLNNLREQDEPTSPNSNPSLGYFCGVGFVGNFTLDENMLDVKGNKKFQATCVENLV
jgi:hypothetical protein